MAYFRKISGKKCYLSPCQPADALKWAEWLNDLEVTLPLGDEAYIPAGVESLRTDIEEIITKQQQVFSIVDAENDRLIGRCLLFNIDPVNRSAMLGIFIGEKAYWGKGYGQEATRLLLDYGFNLLNLHNIMLGVFSFNERAIQAYRKVGFKEMGRRREARIIGDRKFDVVFMDMLADEFKGKITNLIP